MDIHIAVAEQCPDIQGIQAQAETVFLTDQCDVAILTVNMRLTAQGMVCPQRPVTAQCQRTAHLGAGIFRQGQQPAQWDASCIARSLKPGMLLNQSVQVQVSTSQVQGQVFNGKDIC